MAYRLYALLGGGAALLAVGATYWVRSRRKTPEQRERERRQRLCLHGRICDGNILDVQEDDSTQFVVYTYEIGGVAYEASQDITHLRQFVDIHSCKLGLPASVRYNPQNPGDSIVIAEEWMGLRS